MCGIAGIHHSDGSPVSGDVLRAMTAALAHRGPDGEGIWTGGGIGLGHRRLAILDLTPAGHQPMATPEGDVVLTYNGEVYNHRELRAELEAKGRRFRSRADSEVVLEAWREWGPACVERFNGMFAFAVWDARSRRLFLARDRYGIKPLYWTRLGGAFLFASEIKAFRRHPAFRAEVSPPQLMEYFTFQNILTDGTLFRGVRLLPPGHTLTLEPGRDAPSPVPYWDFAFEEPASPRPDAEYEEELDRLFRQAVRRQLVSDVPVGAYLSGGLDSGSITAIAAREMPYLSTFTGGFDLTSASGLELGLDEREKAEALSYLLKTEHYEVVLKAGDMERCLSDLVWHQEDLRVGQSYPNFYVARLASRFVKTVLSGTGGDELFAGYPWRYYRAVVNDDFDHYVEKYYRFWHRLVPAEALPSLFRPDVRREIGDLRPLDVFRSVLARHPRTPRTPGEYVHQSMYFESRTFLHGLLVMEDRLSMAHGLESRVPFLDNDLVDFAQKLPVRLNLKDLEHVVRLNENEPGPKTELYYRQTRDGKLLLRRVMSRYVPDGVVNQVKQGFTGPDASWFKGDSIDYVRNIVHDPRSRIYGFLDPRTVQGLVDDHLAGRENRRLFIWSLLNFEWWCRRFLDSPGES